jgi:D-lyxose ketol-isomerase
MKRSEINRIVASAMRFLNKMKFRLPPFAEWSAAEWSAKGSECAAVVREQLGWDITDFGSGDFERRGLFLFTLRNGVLADAEAGWGKPYAEKIMIVREDQVTPTHFHTHKMEDIINRGGGNLVVRLWNATGDNKLADSDVVVSVDSMTVTLPAGGDIVLRPGQSVALPQRLYHRFWGEKDSGLTLVGEVSLVNDDRIDNHFLEDVGRFPTVEEDEPPVRLLVGDYPRYCRFAVG